MVVVEDEVALVVLVVVKIVDVVVGVGTVVVVLPGVAQPSGPHASQQLGTLPTHASPFAGALQCDASLSTLQRVSPKPSVRQHVTYPSFPHVDFRAQKTTD